MAGDGARASISAVITLGGPPAAEQKLIAGGPGAARRRPACSRPAPARAARSPRRAGTAGSVRAIPWRGVTADWTCVAFYLIRALIRARGRRSRAARLRCIMAHARRCAARYSHANARGVRPAGRPAADEDPTRNEHQIAGRRGRHRGRRRAGLWRLSAAAAGPALTRSEVIGELDGPPLAACARRPVPLRRAPAAGRHDEQGELGSGRTGARAGAGRR